MATSIVKGTYAKYPPFPDRFSNRIADNMDGSDLSRIDSFVSPKSKEMIIKNNEIVSTITVDTINVDNSWLFESNNVIKSISSINR